MVFDQVKRRIQSMSTLVKPIKFLRGRRRIFGDGGESMAIRFQTVEYVPAVNKNAVAFLDSVFLKVVANSR